MTPNFGGDLSWRTPIGNPSASTRKPFELALIPLCLWLFLGNLGSGALWQDEAQTALIARTVLAHGVPMGHEGVHSYSQDLGLDAGPGGLWRAQPWLPYYVLAPFLAVKGSTFSARLPFALFGLATVPLAWLFTRRATGNRRTAFLAALFLASSVPFLLLSRQCKYYSLAAFLSLLSLHGWLGAVEGRKWGTPVLGVALALLFQTQYLYAFAALCAVAAHTLLLRRREGLRPLAVAAGVSLLSLPGLAWFAGAYAKVPQSSHAPAKVLSMGLDYLEKCARYIVQPFAPALALAVLAWRRLRGDRPTPPGNLPVVLLLLLFAGATLSALALASPAAFFRYLAPLIPVGAILLAILAEPIFPVSRTLGALFALVVVAGNPFPDYLHELTHEYRGPVDALVGYLGREAKPGDVVAITYEDLPLKFYTPLRIVGGLTGEPLSPALSADWVVIRQYVICEKDYNVRRYLLDKLPWDKYRAIPLGVPDLPFQNRESPDEHRYRTPEDGPPLIVYRRIAP